MRRSTTAMIGICVAALTLPSLAGCKTGPRLVKHPDTPMLITETTETEVRVSVFNQEKRKLEDFGWVSLVGLDGWTLSKYDWDTFLRGEAP